MYLPGRKDKSVVHEKKKMGPEMHPGHMVHVVTQEDMPEEPRIMLV